MSHWTRSQSTTRDADDPYYGCMRLVGDGMAALREMFPDAQVNDLNFALFSTSGVHGTYCTIEEVERGGPDSPSDVTFVVIQPRIVGIRYGNCTPRTPEDFAFLKHLRATSCVAVAGIGAAPQAEGAPK